MIIKERYYRRQIGINILVLNNSREKKPVAKADIKIVSKGQADYNTKSDDDGHKNGIEILGEKSYEITASANGKSGKTIGFNTIGIKGTKIYDKVVYVERNPEDDINLPLTVTVLTSKKEHKPVAGAKVKITGTDGSSFEGVSDITGKVSGLNLVPEVTYVIVSEKDGVSNKAVLTMHGVKKSKHVEKTVYLHRQV